MNNIIIFQLEIVIHPINTLKKFLIDENRLLYRFLTILLFGLFYTLGVILAYIFEHHPYGIAIILKIPPEKYYLYESLFLLPVTICTWILLAGLIQIISMPIKGKGSFEDTLALIGLPFYILIIFMFIPDMLVDFIIPKNIVQSFIFWKIINSIRLYLASFWILIVHIIAVKEVQKLSNIKSVIVTVSSYILYMIINLTYIR